MELIKRYIHAVVRRLPESQRADIEKELEGLIEDMLEEHSPPGSHTKEEVEAVLLELGDPEALADKYRGAGRYLIGPELFSTYLTVLRVVFAAVAIAMTVGFAVDSLSDASHMSQQFRGYFNDILLAFFQAFAWVTVIFALVEYKGIHKDQLKHRSGHSWTISQLPQLPSRELTIKRSDPIFSIIFTAIFTFLFLFNLHLFGLILQNDGSRLVIPLFNDEVFRSFLPWIWIAFAASVLKETLKIITGRWTPSLIILSVLVSAFEFILALFILSSHNIWNPHFLTQINQSGFIPEGSNVLQLVTTIWEQGTQNLVYIFGLIFVIQLITMAIKFKKARRTVI
ncbi:HAAS signaling domain-containing protein [Paenibacillus sp. NPDC058177]|uniref:HAAS signaling domain-containing protein n=1 Tax=Paenibacillus sp. NPDC058177 TaxID=3346369 RepID=UPI0036DC9E51